MSHRALVAVRRRDGRYDLYDVADRWPPPDEAGTTTTGGGHGPRDGRSAGSPDPEPTAEPSGRRVPFDLAVERFLDPLVHETLLVVEVDGSERRYGVLPYLVATADGLWPDEPAGAAIALGGDDGASLSRSYLRGWHHGVTDVLGEAVDRDLLTAGTAIGWLDAAVHRLAGDRHEVIGLPPG